MDSCRVKTNMNEIFEYFFNKLQFKVFLRENATVIHRLKAAWPVFQIIATRHVFEFFIFIYVEKCAFNKVRTIFGEKSSKTMATNKYYLCRFFYCHGRSSNPERLKLI